MAQKNTGTRANNSNTGTIKEKKAYVMPEALKVKITANSRFKEAVFSASGLVKFAKSEEGAKILQPYLDNLNTKHGTSFKVSNVDTRLWKFGTEKELNQKDGSKRRLFSFWLLQSLIARKVKAMVKPAGNTKPITKEREAAKAA